MKPIKKGVIYLVISHTRDGSFEQRMRKIWQALFNVYRSGEGAEERLKNMDNMIIDYTALISMLSNTNKEKNLWWLHQGADTYISDQEFSFMYEHRYRIEFTWDETRIYYVSNEVGHDVTTTQED